MPRLAMSASAEQFVAGRPAPLRIVVTNGAVAQFSSRRPQNTMEVAAAEDVRIDMTVPAGTSLGGIIGAWRCAVIATTLSCELPNLSAGARTEATLTLTLPAPSAATVSLAPQLSASRLPTPVAVDDVVLSVKTPDGLWYYGEIRGGLAVTGSSVLTCDPAIVTLCADARRAAAPGPWNARQNHQMIALDVDNEPDTWNSSAASVEIPAGASVTKALLTWSGDLRGAIAGVGPSDVTRRNSVVLLGPDGVRSTVTADDLEVVAGREVYGARADVTDLIRTGGTVTVGNVQTRADVPSGFGGWALLVVYDDPAAALATVAVDDRFQSITSGAGVRSLPVVVEGPRTAVVALVAFEGDRGLPDESVTVNGVALGDPANDAFDVFNSSVATDGVHRSSTLNHFGVDADRIAVGLDAAAPELTVRVSSPSDVLRLAVVGVVVPR